MTAVTLSVINADGSTGTLTVDPALHSRRVRPNPTTISSHDFFNRFTDGERAAVWAAAATTPALGVGLVQGLALGQIDLTSDVLKTWLDALVSAGALTSDRETAILTP